MSWFMEGRGGGRGFGHSRGGRGGFPMHGFGDRFPHQNWMDSDSDGDSMPWHPKPWKHLKKMHKLRHLMHHSMNGSAVCSLCAHQLKAGTDVELLECGHLYHRVCLKHLITLMVNTRDDVFCTCCTQTIEPQVLDALKVKLAVQTVVNDANIAASI